MLLAGEEWAARFAEFQREAWRLETLPQYLMPQEAKEFESFRGGARVDPADVSNEYTDRLRRQVAHGRSQGRVHVLTVRSPTTCGSSSITTTRLTRWPVKRFAFST